jgi:hypothetical protein
MVFVNLAHEWHNKMHYFPWSFCAVNDCVLARNIEERYDMNICLCGTQAGYPHDKLCPYPLYRGSEEQEQRWLHKWKDKRNLTSGSTATSLSAGANVAAKSKSTGANDVSENKSAGA